MKARVLPLISESLILVASPFPLGNHDEISQAVRHPSGDTVGPAGNGLSWLVKPLPSMTAPAVFCVYMSYVGVRTKSC